MSRYARHNPDEPVRHDWLAGGRQVTLSRHNGGNIGETYNMNAQNAEKFAQIRRDLEALQSEFQTSFDAMSETAQEGEKGEQLTTNIEAIGNALGELEEVG